jgi:3alpha(or 20beta)-hydroxysteroid dehydrogenase
LPRLEGKVAIITGAARGMGRATAELFAQERAKLVLADVLDAEGAALASVLGDSAWYHHLDVTDENGWEQLAEATVERYGRIDILVNNAAVYFYALLQDTSCDAFRRLLSINLVGPFLGMKAVLPYMKKNRAGSIINVSSTDGLRGSCGMGAYNSSKWGLRGLTKCIAMEAGPFGIRVNSLHPGATDTPMNNPDGRPYDEVNKEFNQKWPGIALSRMAQSPEVARASLFLASDEASYISGAELAVDGGWTCGVYLLDKPSPQAS